MGQPAERARPLGAALVPGHPAAGRRRGRRPPRAAAAPGGRRPPAARGHRRRCDAGVPCTGDRARGNRDALLRRRARPGGAADRARLGRGDGGGALRRVRGAGAVRSRQRGLVLRDLGAVRRPDRRRDDDGRGRRRAGVGAPPGPDPGLRGRRDRLRDLHRLRQLGRAAHRRASPSRTCLRTAGRMCTTFWSGSSWASSPR